MVLVFGSEIAEDLTKLNNPSQPQTILIYVYLTTRQKHRDALTYSSNSQTTDFQMWQTKSDNAIDNWQCTLQITIHTRTHTIATSLHCMNNNI